MKKTLLCLTLAGALSACDTGERNTETTDTTATETNDMDQDSQWISLFDGQTLNGWTTYGKNTVGAAWKVQDGVLFFDSSEEEGGDIVTDEVFDNFHLELEWKISKDGNSGIMFYVQESDEYRYPWQTGPEMQILDNDGHPDAKIRTHRAGDLYDLIESSEETVKPVGEWNKAEIISNNGQLDFYLNGVNTVSTTMWDEQWDEMVANSKFKGMPGFGRYQEGKIALQDHDDDVWFRNIRIKRL
ncbi:DUF1080 domain-containing protein [Litoribacter alkaliphilus]|uniref:DUF1080 domain-containing protein n=1 Tax=Litoribacter ruber TaxID=702568 RepID=A0AAP2CFQ9_9BACT|nr:DUF1080 domain-containing protein [Litoribacter alkaliphilus]MBS9523773.1 DUF1080 domain-containing protein [Litoribacter alkaliphilus]